MRTEDLEYVVSVFKGENPKEEADWYATTGFLFAHRIAGLFYNRAKALSLKLPAKMDKTLQECYETQKRKVEFMREQIKEIADGLRADSCAYILLKGSVLSNIADDDIRIYADGERVSNDIDLLVKSDEISAVCKALCELGFVQGVYDASEQKIREFSRMEIVKRRMNRGEVAPFVKLTGNQEMPFVEVDINFSLGNTPQEGIELLSFMVDSGREYHGKADIRIVEEELFFLHLIMHQYKESRLLFMVERGKDLDLYKLTDIYYLYKANVMNLEKLKELVKKFALENAVGVVLSQVGEIFADNELLTLAKQYGNVQPIVIDYENKKAYRWTKTIKERMCRFNAKDYLEEVEYVD